MLKKTVIKTAIIEAEEFYLECDKCEVRLDWMGELRNGDHVYKCPQCGHMDSASYRYPYNQKRKPVIFDDHGKCCRCHGNLDGVSWRKVLHSKILALCGRCAPVMPPDKE